MRFKVIPVTSDGTAAPAKSKTYFSINLFNSVQDTFNSLVNRFIAGDYPVKSTGAMPSGSLGMGNSLTYVDPNVEGTIEFEVPYYNVSHISPATTYVKATESPITINNVLRGHVPPEIVSISPRGAVLATAPINAQIVRAPADDFSFMYLVGVPPLVNVNRSSIP